MQAGLTLDGRFLQRAGLYAEAGRPTFEALLEAEGVVRGRIEVRNALEHCEGEGSWVEQMALGWIRFDDPAASPSEAGGA